MGSGRAQHTEMPCQGHVGLAVHLPHCFQALETLVLHNKLSQSPRTSHYPGGSRKPSMAVPQGVSIVLYAVTRGQRFASFLSKSQPLFLSLHLFSQLLFVGAEG